LSILMVVSVVFSFFVQITEVRQTDQTRPSLAIIWSDLIHTKAVPVAMISVCVGTASARLLSFVPVCADAMPFATTASYFCLVVAIVMVVFRPYLGRAFDEKGAKIVLVPSLIIFAIGLATLGVTNGSIMLLVAAGLIGLGYGTLLPGFQTLAIQRTTADRSGHA